jgi:hypothetical protein
MELQGSILVARTATASAAGSMRGGMATRSHQIAAAGVGDIMEWLSRGVFGLASLVLMLIAIALSIYGAYLMVAALGQGLDKAGPGLLEAIGYVVIAVAVFDVAKYFVDEEVIRGREMRIAAEARRSLTKFVSTIVIAVFIEALVMVFREGGRDVSRVLYPAVILLMGILIILGLGVYQRLSAIVEQEVDDKVEDQRTR